MWSWWTHVKASRTLLLVLLTPLLALPLPLLVPGLESRCAYVVLIMAVYWISEAVPIAATAFLPVILMPFLGILSAKVVTKAYIKDTVMMGLGALSVAIGVETWNLHKRIALRVLLFVGSEPRWMMLGMMLATWFLSMWISNTSTTAMMIPITEATLRQLRSASVKLEDIKLRDKEATHTVDVPDTNSTSREVKEMMDDADTVKGGVETVKESREVKPTSATSQADENDDGDDDPHFKRLCTGMSLSICYAANCGGIATVTGTGPNIIVKGFTDDLYAQYGEKNPVNFATWMGLGLPLSVLMLTVCWIWLQIVFLRCSGACRTCRRSGADDRDVQDRVKAIIRNEYNKLGPVTFAEGSMLFWFAVMVLLWITRDLGGTGGWQNIFNEGYLSGSTVAVAISFILYFYPSTPPAIFAGRRLAEKHSSHKNIAGVPKLTPLLNWKIVQQKMPWGLIILWGGGFALAKGCEESGLSLWVGEQLKVFTDLDRWGMAFVLCYITAAVTEVTSNSAISTLLMPILSSLAIGTGVHPLYYIFAGGIACSFAYMLPVATPPNAVVFSYGRVKIIDMMKAGVVLNILAVPLLVLALGTWGNALFDFQNPPDFFFRNVTSSTSSA